MSHILFKLLWIYIARWYKLSQNLVKAGLHGEDISFHPLLPPPPPPSTLSILWCLELSKMLLYFAILMFKIFFSPQISAISFFLQIFLATFKQFLVILKRTHTPPLHVYMLQFARMNVYEMDVVMSLDFFPVALMFNGLHSFCVFWHVHLKKLQLNFWKFSKVISYMSWCQTTHKIREEVGSGGSWRAQFIRNG